MDLDTFVADCESAIQKSGCQPAIKEILERYISNPTQVLNDLGEPSKAEIALIHRSATLTIFNAVWAPNMTIMPHNHLMWANIGIYTGREDNIIWKETDDGIEAFGAEALFAKDTSCMPLDAVHSVTNPLPRFTGGIHVYGGDFFDQPRSRWDPETLEEIPSDGAAMAALFDAENERLGN